MGVIMESDRTGRRSDADPVVDTIISKSRHFAHTVNNTDALGPAVKKAIAGIRSENIRPEAKDIFEQAMNAYKEAVEKHMGIATGQSASRA